MPHSRSIPIGLLIPACALLSLASAGWQGGLTRLDRAPIPLVTPEAGLKITHNTRLAPGSYNLAGDNEGALVVTGDDLLIDCRGVKITGFGKGTGLHLVDCHNVTVRGLDAAGYLWGVEVERSSGVILESCTANHNGDLAPGVVIDESGRGPEDQHGGGFLLRDTERSRLYACMAQHEWDGLDVVRCKNNTFRGNDFSYLNNWGVHLWAASHNTVAQNRCIWCTTGEGRLYQGRSGWSTFDSAAILMEHDSTANLIDGNDLRYGGDGIFIRANEEPVVAGSPFPKQHSSSRNFLRNNDCSFSPNNAVEADFCDDNTFTHNNCSMSNYGFWLGYSRRAIVEQCTIVGCSSRAIQVENGQEDTFRHNTFINPAERSGQSLVYLYQNGRDHTPSGPYTIQENVFAGSTRPVELEHTTVTTGGNSNIDAPLYVSDATSKVNRDRPDQAAAAPPPSVTRIAPASVPAGGALAALVPITTVVPGAYSVAAYRTILTLSGTRLQQGAGEPVVEVAHAPAMVIAAEPDKLVIAVPNDLWNRPAAAALPVRVFNGEAFGAERSVAVDWISHRPRIETLNPSSVAPGERASVSGEFLQGPDGSQPQVLLNDAQARVIESTPSRLVFAAPGGLLSTHHYNLVIRAVGESVPVDFTVAVPASWAPHIVSASFSPTTLHRGDLLHFSAVIKNNAPFTLGAAEPGAGHVYNESESYQSQGIPEKYGYVYLRVTNDLKGGAWPYLWGLTDPLPPGETAVIEGDIRVETPGATHYRMGLVDGQIRWIDDGVFNTAVTVEGAG